MPSSLPPLQRGLSPKLLQALFDEGERRRDRSWSRGKSLVVSVGKKRRVPAIAQLGLLYYVTLSGISQQSTVLMKPFKTQVKKLEFFLLKL